MQQITVDIRTVYGRETIYPACPTAQLLAELAGDKTLTRSSLDKIKRLGFAIAVKQKEI